MKALLLQALLLLLALLLPGCNPPSFEAPSDVDSVRVLATRADTSYAPPGAKVNLQVLAVDGRVNPSDAMQVYWLPAACINPPGDAYYGCFPGFGGQFRRGVDLAGELSSGSAFSFQMPDDVIASHAGVAGEPPYGLAVVFTLACAGHVEYRPELAASPDAVPFACFDAAEHRLGAEDFVFAYSLVYAFADRSNENPTLEGVTYGGTLIDPSAGLQIQHCQKSSIDDCSAVKLDVNVPRSSQEPDPSNLSASGDTLGESLYVQYYATGGKIANDTTVIFDARAGRLAQTGDDFRAPLTPGEYQLWAVVHDNRGGVVWQALPLHVN
jgi:hypothetical protein